jgi:hypothetical protein
MIAHKITWAGLVASLLAHAAGVICFYGLVARELNYDKWMY